MTSMAEQLSLEFFEVHEQAKFEPELQNNSAGIPSAHNSEVMYHPYYDGKRWVCDGENGPCQHFKIYGTPCRHIIEMKFRNVQEMYDHICQKVETVRDMRDVECQDFDDVITYMGIYKALDMNKLATLMLNIGVLRGQVSTDDLHTATKEQYADNMVIGCVCGALLREGLIEIVDRKKTERKCAHGRGINVYSVTKKGFEALSARRPEIALEV